MSNMINVLQNGPTTLEQNCSPKQHLSLFSFSQNFGFILVHQGYHPAEEHNQCSPGQKGQLLWNRTVPQNQTSTPLFLWLSFSFALVYQVHSRTERVDEILSGQFTCPPSLYFHSMTEFNPSHNRTFALSSAFTRSVSVSKVPGHIVNQKHPFASETGNPRFLCLQTSALHKNLSLFPTV